MKPGAMSTYHTRFRKVLEYIDLHLDDTLTLERLSSVAALSKCHFHRQFSGLFGIGVYKYIQLRRLKRASFQLAFRGQASITEIALANGYEGTDSFSRAFSKSIGQSPTAFRRQPLWNPWCDIYQPLSELRNHYMKPALNTDQVRIIHFTETRVAVLEHRGDPRMLANSIRKFIEWRKQNHLPPRISATFNIAYDDPDEVAPEEYRFDLCAALDHAVEENEFGIVGKTIPAGRCAVLRHRGSDDTLRETVLFLYSQWLPQSGEELRDFPVYFQRVTFFPDVPEHEAVTDLFLPLK